MLRGRRFHDKVAKPGSRKARRVPADFPARSMFQKGWGAVRDPALEQTVLKSAQHSPKIGGIIEKGRWAGMPVFTLTLEERATCPRSCGHWADCYGNNMNWARRLKHGPELEDRLAGELRILNKRHPKGFVVRLHVLGDFYSVAYVNKWRRWLRENPACRVYGYTAWQPDTPIGAAVRRLRDEDWGRFAVRTSDGPMALEANTVSARNVHDPAAALGTVCPMQVDATECCATCGLCWQGRGTIVFLDH